MMGSESSLRANDQYVGSQRALVLAIERRSPEHAHEAIRQGALINAPSAQGLLPLAYFVGREDLESIRIAKELGANSEQLIDTRGTPLSLAAKLANPEPLRTLLLAGSNPNSLAAGSPLIHIAGRAGAMRNVGLLVELGADINLTPSSGDSLLVAALFAGQLDLAELALSLGCDPTRANIFGVSALQLANDKLARLTPSQRGEPAARKLEQLRRQISQKATN